MDLYGSQDMIDMPPRSPPPQQMGFEDDSDMDMLQDSQEDW